MDDRPPKEKDGAADDHDLTAHGKTRATLSGVARGFN